MQISSGIVSVAIGFSVAFAADQGAEIINPPPRALVVERLSFEGGAFTQEIHPTAGDGMSANWAAEINRISGGLTDQLCAGGGPGVYNGTVDTYRTDEWVGDDCPDLQDGDIAEAVWTWTDGNGLVRSVSATLVIE